MGEAKDTEADEDDLSGRAQADCGGAESTVGEGKAHRVTPADSGSMRPDHLPRWASGPPLFDVRGSQRLAMAVTIFVSTANSSFESVGSICSKLPKNPFAASFVNA